MIAVGMPSCTIAMQFCPRSLALHSFVALPLVCPLSPASRFMVGPCVQVLSVLILHWKFSVTGARGRWPVGGCHGYPFICILPTLACSLPALLSIGTYLPFWILHIEKLILYTCLKVLKRSDLEASPSMLSATTVLARDLELPGLPTTNSGILSSIHTTIINTFSLKAVLRAMLRPNSNWFSTAFWHLARKWQI